MKSKYLYDYCERMGLVDLWAEPFNAFTNLAFLIAAVLSWRACKQHNLRKYLDIHLLYGLMFLIGIGSLVWHLQPSEASLMLDVVPITAFINIYLFSLLRRCFKWNYGRIVIAFVLLHKLNYVANNSLPSDYLNGSILYAPTWLMLAVLCVVAWWQKLTFATNLIKISGLWSISLIFRTIDHELCGIIPIGTHFIWHLLNAIVLYHLLKLLNHLIYKL
jgi:hypothetical protein